VIILLSLLIALIGLVVYLGSNPANTKAAEVGRISFFAGLFVFLLKADPSVVKLFSSH